MLTHPNTNQTERPTGDPRKPYAPPAILISLPLEASAGQTVIGGRPDGTDTGDGWDDGW